MVSNKPSVAGYESLYSVFDSSLMRRLRYEAYGEDIGQHSWVTADEMRSDTRRLALNSSSRVLDVGCGPCGPLVFAVKTTGCAGTGLDTSASALELGRARALVGDIRDKLTFLEADLNLPITLADASFDAVMSLDVVIHLHNRQAFFQEIARLLVPSGRFLFTDAGVVTGPLSNIDVEQRSVNGYTQFVPPGINEAGLQGAGFSLLDKEDRTESVLSNASGRLQAMFEHQAELQILIGPDAFARQIRYVESVVALSKRKALSRFMYLAEVPLA